jgi:type IV pilus assembly protein PilP
MKKRNNNYLIMVYLVVGLLVLGGCKKEGETPTPPTAKPMPAVKVTTPVQKPLSSAKIGENLAPSLDFNNRKDPFKSSVAPKAQVAKPAASTGKNSTKDLLPIQSYELSKFKVAGIIVGLKENTALVIDPAGKGYVVKQGMLIGSDDGKITRITATTIEVVESYNDNGRIRKKTSKLILPQKK